MKFSSCTLQPMLLAVNYAIDPLVVTREKRVIAFHQSCASATTFWICPQIIQICPNCLREIRRGLVEQPH